MRVIPRAEWGARLPDGGGPAPLPAREVWLHHSAGAAPDPLRPVVADDAAVRALERTGHQRFGAGISYTFLVTPSGRVYEGHGVGRAGTHTRGRNTVGRAICLIGDYEVRRPTPAQIDAVVWLVRHGRDRNWWVRAALAGGHRDAPGARTACPGRFAHALIPTINQRAGGPQVEAELTPEESRMLADLHRQATTPLANRRGPGGATADGQGADTHFGYAINADGTAYRIEREVLPEVLAALARIENRLEALERRPPG